MLVEATILARLLRIRLLRLDATIVIVPADAGAPSPQPADAPMRPPPRRAPALQGPTSAAGRHSLAEAVRTIEESAAILAEARRTAGASVSAGRPPAPRPRG